MVPSRRHYFIKEWLESFYDHPILDEIASGKNANYINCYPKAPGPLAPAFIRQPERLNMLSFTSWHFYLHLFSIHSFHASMVLFFNSKRFHVIVCGRFFSCGGWSNAQFLCGWAVGGFYIAYTLFLCDWVSDLESKVPQVLLGLCLIYLANIKFTGLIYSIVFLFLHFLGCFGRSGRRP